ncbi:hypothetical protein [Streptomyces candidus]|uniref:Uncharacterized protein n=1 Tax=Streptomyces candidus TaxID=67283 RepID=A0A7X0LS06_9ACTN|nr:hypothetical protein [Streptomyces candidus]MBB6437521.1 hypothetical protein [Streptomyces candidus]GHH54435.1 hypothetical protein GCM10018773_57470 [Streptomyces candidus]
MIPPLTAPAWWCEFTATGANGVGVRQARSVAAPTHAVIWMRDSLRTLVSTLARAEREAAHDWLGFGQWEAVTRLRADETYTFRASMHGAELIWTARRVTVLRMVPGPVTACQYASAPADRS